MEISKTYRQVINIEEACLGYIERTDKKETALSLEVARFIRKQINPIKEEFQEELYMNQVKCAYKDNKGVLARDEKGGFQITEEGEAKRIKLNKELMEKEVGIHTRFIDDIPEDLTEDEVEAFEGIFWQVKTN